jgi:hypothetical protein
MAILRIFARFAYVPTLAIGLNFFAVWLISRGFSYAWTGLLFAAAIGLSLLMEDPSGVSKVLQASPVYRPHETQRC